MATIITLSGPDGPLTRINVRLRRGQQPERTFYGCAEFMEALTTELPTWECGRLRAAQSPQEQMRAILDRWISGRPVTYGRMFQDLIPATDEAWEHKSADLRIFGWIYRPRVFIAVRLGYADWYKGHNPRFSYEDARRRVVKVRNELDLDEPKFTGGVFDALV